MRKNKRPSISVSRKTYDQLRASVHETSLSKFVEGIVLSALEDPTIRDRVIAKCCEWNAAK